MKPSASSKPLKAKRGLGWWLWGSLWLLILAILTAFSLAGFWGREGWRLDALAHFRLQYLAASAVLGLMLIWRRRWLLLIPALALALLNAYWVFNWPANPGLWREPALKAISINVYSRNDDIERVVAYLEEEQPDFVALIEITGAWRPSLEQLKERFPFQEVRIYGDTFGSALLSSHPMTERTYPYAGVGSIAKEVQTPSGMLTLLLVHPLAPVNEKAWTWRNQTLQQIVAFCKETDGPILALGDYNCTPWSPVFQDFLKASGLSLPDARALPRRTWPAGKPWFWIPIDHFLLTADLTALAEWTGPSVGSDHYPIGLIFAFSGDAG